MTTALRVIVVIIMIFWRRDRWPVMPVQGIFGVQKKIESLSSSRQGVCAAGERTPSGRSRNTRWKISHGRLRSCARVIKPNYCDNVCSCGKNNTPSRKWIRRTTYSCERYPPHQRWSSSCTWVERTTVSSILKLCSQNKKTSKKHHETDPKLDTNLHIFHFFRSSSCVGSRSDRTPPTSCRFRTPGVRSRDPFRARCKKSNHGNKGPRRRLRTQNTEVRPTRANPTIRITW